MRALVIGGGPAGLMAADVLGSAGAEVLVAEQKTSLARKFLMAGKSGLNLTKREEFEAFLGAYGARAGVLRPMLEQFGPVETEDWAEGLGQEMFAGSTGRVFPRVMKASPLLRAWLARLDALGVRVETGWRWDGFEDNGSVFATPEGARHVAPEVTVLAMGGASWARLGSDGLWAERLADVAAFKPANGGLKVEWSPAMASHYGSPVKGVGWRAGAMTGRGEAVVSARGLEGGGIYEVFAAVRDGAALEIDLVPDLTVEQVRTRLARPRGKASLSNHLRKTLGLDGLRRALLMEFARPLPEDLAPRIKSLTVRHAGPRPMDEAISVAGGLRFDALSPGLEMRARPGVFACGEMLDWEAPTGGYLLTACLATGLWAGQHAAARVTYD